MEAIQLFAGGAAMFRVLSHWLRKAAGRILFVLSIFVISPMDGYPQASSSEFGTGGANTIRGRIFADGRRSDVSGLIIRLKSMASPDITVLSDQTGTFVFRGLSGGTYTIKVEGGDAFEDATEQVVIDAMGSSSLRNAGRIRATPQTAHVQIFLRPAIRTSGIEQTGVFNVKWSNVPKKAVDHYDQGLRLLRKGRDSEAEAEFRRALDAAPNFAPAHTALGRIKQRAGKLTEAVDHWTTALRYDESDFDAHLNLGIACLNLKKLDEAERELVSAAFLDKAAVTPHYYLGLLFVVKNDLGVAQKAFETAKGLDSGNTMPAIHKYLGRIYSTSNKRKEAIKELEAYLDLAPKAPDAEQVRRDIADIKSKAN